MSAKAAIDNEALAQAIVETGSVGKACDKLGLDRVTVWRRSRTDKELEKVLWASRQVVAEMCYDECMAIADDGSNDTYIDEDGNRRVDHDVIARSRLRIEARRQVAGTLMHALYGDKPQNVTNIQNNTALICDEATRERLLTLRAKIESARTRALPAADAPPRVGAD